jgi:hypothetical protein
MHSIFQGQKGDSIAVTIHLMRFKEIIAVYSESRMEVTIRLSEERLLLRRASSAADKSYY